MFLHIGTSTYFLPLRAFNSSSLKPLKTCFRPQFLPFCLVHCLHPFSFTTPVILHTTSRYCLVTLSPAATYRVFKYPQKKGKIYRLLYFLIPFFYIKPAHHSLTSLFFLHLHIYSDVFESPLSYQGILSSLLSSLHLDLSRISLFPKTHIQPVDHKY